MGLKWCPDRSEAGRPGGASSPEAAPTRLTDAQLRTERLTWPTAEYASLREEAIVAQSNQQAAMHWGLAVVSGSLVGGFALSAKEGTPSLSVQQSQPTCSVSWRPGRTRASLRDYSLRHKAI